MKKSFLFLVIGGWFSLAHAQGGDPDIVITGSNKITKELTPKQIIDSLQKRFPNAQSVQYYKTKPETVKAGWDISEQNDLSSVEDVDTYTLTFKRSDFKWYALYDANGKLLSAKYEEYDTQLPTAVTDAVKKLAADKYKNYKLLSKTHYKQVNYGKAKDYYVVTGINKTNSNDKKTLVLAPDGTLIKEK